MPQLVERRVGDQKVADSRFDSRAGNASLCFLKSTLYSKQSTLCGGPADKKLANIKEVLALVWL